MWRNCLRILADRLGKNVTLEPRPVDPGLREEARKALGLTADEIERAAEPANKKAERKQAGKPFPSAIRKGSGSKAACFRSVIVYMRR